MTMLLVEQPHKALEVADYGYVIEHGRIEVEGAAETLRADPARALHFRRSSRRETVSSCFK
jgi:ABC-type branched-subunit amino acid transport system ATPase component